MFGSSRQNGFLFVHFPNETICRKQGLNFYFFRVFHKLTFWETKFRILQIFSANGKNFSVDAEQTASSQSNSISIVANLSSISSSIYTMKVDLGFSKSKRRILSTRTANYFVVRWSSITFFIGNDAEIVHEKSGNQSNQTNEISNEKSGNQSNKTKEIGDEKSGNQTNKKELTNEDIFEIVFIIFGFFILLGLFCCFWHRIKKKSSKGEGRIVFTRPR